MNVYQKNMIQMLKIGNFAILLHIPVFVIMANFFGTELSIAIFGPLLLLTGQIISQFLLKNEKLSSVLMGFSVICLSALMIHLGKGMIEWHFHIFVSIGILSLLANPLTIISAALTAAVHHISFYFLIPESIFNYQASLGIVVIHAAFVVIESIACSFLSYRFKNVLDLQQKINVEIAPLVFSIDDVSKITSQSCSDLLRSTDDNSSAITEISSTAEQINQMVSATKKQIENVLNTMKSTGESVKESSEAIKNGETFIDKLNLIKESMDKLQSSSSNQLNEVSNSVNTISDKTKIINDIVFQTKLLSFNASVEAARAGEHGKGFAVVAEEIGALANTSGAAAEEIGSIVNQSKTQLNESIDSVSKSLKAFQIQLTESFTMWDSINQKLKQSFVNVEKNSKVQETSLVEISQAADQQHQGITELTKALTQIDQVSHRSVGQLKQVEEMTHKLEADSVKLHLIHEEISQNKKAA